MMGFPDFWGDDLSQASADHDTEALSRFACHSSDRSSSRVLVEMESDTNPRDSAVRILLGRETTSEDVRYVKDQLGHTLEGTTI